MTGAKHNFWGRSLRAFFIAHMAIAALLEADAVQPGHADELRLAPARIRGIHLGMTELEMREVLREQGATDLKDHPYGQHGKLISFRGGVNARLKSDGTLFQFYALGPGVQIEGGLKLGSSTVSDFERVLDSPFDSYVLPGGKQVQRLVRDGEEILLFPEKGRPDVVFSVMLTNLALAARAEQPPPADTRLFTMNYKVSGRFVLDARRIATEGQTFAKSYLESAGVTFPPSTFAQLTNTTLAIRNTRQNLLLTEALIGSLKGMPAGINKSVNEMFPKNKWPAQTGASISDGSTRRGEQQEQDEPGANGSSGHQVSGERDSAPEPSTAAKPNSIQPFPEGAEPEFNGVPLAEFLASAVVATARTPIYDVSASGERAFGAALDRIAEKYSAANANSSYPAYAERFEALQALAKSAMPDRVLGHVRPGFLAKTLHWKNSHSAPVLLPKELGGMRFGAVEWRDFTMIGEKRSRSWWNDSSNDWLSRIPPISGDAEFVSYPLTVKSMLADPFEGAGVVLSNHTGAMKNAWILKPSSPATSNGERSAPPLGVVETGDGLFLGYLMEKDAAGMKAMTWEQAVAAKGSQFIIRAQRKTDMLPGKVILHLFDADERIQIRQPSANPEAFVLYPETFAEVLAKGTWALKTSVVLPSDGGFEPISELETSTGFAFEIQKKLERIQLRFDALDDATARFLVLAEYSVREVERRTNSNGSETISEGRWQKKKEQSKAELSLSGDGAIRFTDGEKIYYIAPGTMGQPQLVVYTVEENTLSR